MGEGSSQQEWSGGDEGFEVVWWGVWGRVISCEGWEMGRWDGNK